MSPTPDSAPDPAPNRLNALPSRLLVGVATVADRLVAERLAAVGARKWHFAVLAALEEAGSASQADLSRRTGIYRSDMVAVLNELADAECVHREPDPVDRRRNVITLTLAGHLRLERLDAIVTEAQEEFLAPLDPEQQGQLTHLLTVLSGHHRPHETMQAAPAPGKNRWT